MANLDLSKISLGSADAMTQKLSYFNNYVTEYAATTLKLNPTTDLLKNPQVDFPLTARLIYFTATDIQGLPFSPVIVLPVNPDTFRVAYKKKSDAIYTLGGFVINHWHDDVIMVTATGYIPSFRSRAKILSSSYHLFLQLLNLYKSCGQVVGEYTKQFDVASGDPDKIASTISAPPLVSPRAADFPGGVSDPGFQQAAAAYAKASQAASTPGLVQSATEKTDTIIVQGNSLRNAKIQLLYQHDVYTGIFMDFTVDEDYEQPNTLKYAFTFKATTHQNIITDNIPNAGAATGIGTLQALSRKVI